MNAFLHVADENPESFVGFCWCSVEHGALLAVRIILSTASLFRPVQPTFPQSVN